MRTRASALLVVATLAGACAERAIDVGNGVATTLHFDATVTDEALARVHELRFITDEPFESALVLDRTAQRTERTVYRPFARTRSLALTVVAYSNDGAPLAVGSTNVPDITPGKTAEAEVVLAAPQTDLGSPNDLSGSDLIFIEGNPDLVSTGADLAGADLSSGSDLGVSQIPPYLTTKTLSGKPGAAAPIVFQGELPRLRMVFKNAANEAVAISTISSGSTVTLPIHAGLYRTELTDISTGKVSYGTATVNGAFTTWSASSNTISHSFGVYRGWPATALALGDVNHDGYTDFVFASGTLDTGALSNPGLYVYRFNNGTQAFTLAQTLSTSAAVMAAAFVDVNGDGWLDLVYSVNTNTATAGVSGRVFISLNDGTGSFLTATSFALPAPTTGQTYLFQLAVADLNRDGISDLVFVGSAVDTSMTYTGLVYVLLGTGGGSYSASLLQSAGAYPFYSIDIADANDDGQLDLYLYGGPTQGLYRFYQQAPGQFSKNTLGTDYDTDVAAHGNFWYDQVRTGYLFGKSRPDAIVTHVDGPSTVFAASSTTNALVASSIPAPSTSDQHGTAPVIADLDGDGTQEIYIPLKNRALYANKPGVYWRLPSTLTTSTAVSASNTITGYTGLASWSLANAFFDDINHDGKIDLLMPVAYMNLSNVVFAN
jgi:hypothetical protein